jgi:hypothetical protein
LWNAAKSAHQASFSEHVAVVSLSKVMLARTAQTLLPAT